MKHLLTENNKKQLQQQRKIVREVKKCNPATSFSVYRDKIKNIMMKNTTLRVQYIISKIKSHKYFLLACLCAGAFSAIAYLYVYPSRYEAVATLRPVDRQPASNSSTTATDAAVLQSRKMIERAVNGQSLNVVYTKTRPMQKRELFGNAPFLVNYSIQDKNFSMQNFDIAFISEKDFLLSYQAGSVPMQQEGSFNNELDLGFIKLNISRTPYSVSSSDLDKYHFAVYSNNALAQRIASENFSCKPVNNSANVVEISYQNENPSKAFQVVNAVARAYGQSETANNEELVRANVDQINNQLARVSQELDLAQSEIAAFKVENNAFELPQQAGANLNTVSQLQVQKVEVDMQLAALDNMGDYLRKNRNVNSISPEYGTINDLIYTETYLKLTDKAAERQQVKEAGGDVAKLDREINGLKDMLAESIRNTRKKLTIKQQAMANAIVIAKSRMENMPEAENRLQQLNRNVYLYTKLYDFLIQKRAEAMVSAPVFPTGSYMVDEASMPMIPVTPGEAEVWAIALLASLLGGAVVIAVKPMLKTRISNREELQQYTDIPFIANIDNSKNEEFLTEPFMNLCTKILLMDQENPVKMVTLTSTHSGEGKTTIAQNLAKTYASLDKKVLLVDMNPVNPGLELAFDVQNENSIAAIYREEANLHQAVSLTTVPNVDLLKAGQLKNGINTFLTSGKTGNIIADIKELYDLVVFDTPETSNYIDAIPLMKASDLNLYVVKSNTASASYVKQASVIKNDFGIRNMYIVLNGMTEVKNHSGIETSGRFKILKGRQQAESEVRLIPRMLKKQPCGFTKTTIEMKGKSAFLTHFFDKLKEVKYAVLGFTYQSLDHYDSNSLHLVVNREDNKSIYHILEFSPYLKHIRLIEKPFVSTITLTLGDGSQFDINLVNAFVRKGICYMSEVEVLRNTLTDKLGIKQAAPSYNFEYVWLLHLLNRNNVAEHYRAFFSQYDREIRSGIFAHIRGRYFLELNILDELYNFHKRPYHQVSEKILRRKENKWYLKLIRKLHYIPYAIVNMLHVNSLKIKISTYKNGAFSPTEQVRIY